MNDVSFVQIRKPSRNSFDLEKSGLNHKTVRGIEKTLTIASLSTSDVVGSEKKERRSPKVQRGVTIPVEGIAGSSTSPNKGNIFGCRRGAHI